MYIKQIGNYEIQIQKPSAYEVIRHSGVFFKFVESPQSLEVKDVDEFILALCGNCKAVEMESQKEFRFVSAQLLVRVFGDDLKTLLEFLGEMLQEIFQLSTQFLNQHPMMQDSQTHEAH